VCEYLLEEGKLAEVTNRLGITDLIKTEVYEKLLKILIQNYCSF
jgi:hypothetical protein